MAAKAPNDQRTMRAAFFEAAHTITVRSAPIPETEADDVRLRVMACGICGSDLSLYKTGVLAGPGVILGHEVSAVVESDPSGQWEAGARVVPYPGGRGCGTCVWCREGSYRYCMNAPGFHGGGFAEFMAVPRRDLIAVPDDLDDRMAALAEPVGVALRGVEMADPSPGDLAYVSGLGSIGLFTVVALVAAGCRVIGADPRVDRRALGVDLGCVEAFDPAADDPAARTTAVDPHGPRNAFECSGSPESLQQVFDTCGHRGVVGILGIPMAPVFLLRMTLRELRAFSIQGPTVDSMRAALELLRARPEAGKVISNVVPLDGANQAFADLAGGSGEVKVLVEPGG